MHNGWPGVDYCVGLRSVVTQQMLEISIHLASVNYTAVN